MTVLETKLFAHGLWETFDVPAKAEGVNAATQGRGDGKEPLEKALSMPTACGEDSL